MTSFQYISLVMLVDRDHSPQVCISSLEYNLRTSCLPEPAALDASTGLQASPPPRILAMSPASAPNVRNCRSSEQLSHLRNLHTLSIPTANAPALYFLRGIHDYGIRVGPVGVGVQWVGRVLGGPPARPSPTGINVGAPSTFRPQGTPAVPPCARAAQCTPRGRISAPLPPRLR